MSPARYRSVRSPGRLEMTRAQESAWDELSNCPGCRAGEEPLPGSTHERLWRVVTVAWLKAAARHRRRRR